MYRPQSAQLARLGSRHASEIRFNQRSRAHEPTYYWEKLSAGGDVRAQQCGWLKDKYGVSWQVVPRVLPDMLKDHESSRAQRVMGAALKMKKIDIGALERAAAA